MLSFLLILPADHVSCGISFFSYSPYTQKINTWNVRSGAQQTASSVCVYVCVCVGVVGLLRRWMGWGGVGLAGVLGVGVCWGKLENSCDLFFPLLFQSFSPEQPALLSSELRSLQSEASTSTWPPPAEQSLKGVWYHCQMAIIIHSHTHTRTSLLPFTGRLCLTATYTSGSAKAAQWKECAVLVCVSVCVFIHTEQSYFGFVCFLLCSVLLWLFYIKQVMPFFFVSVVPFSLTHSWSPQDGSWLLT